MLGTPTLRLRRIRFRNLRARLDLPRGVCAYVYRHGFCTDALEKGIPIATVAELMGHANTAMISKVYSKLSERRRHLAEMAAKAAGGEPPADLFSAADQSRIEGEASRGSS